MTGSQSSGGSIDCSPSMSATVFAVTTSFLASSAGARDGVTSVWMKEAVIECGESSENIAPAEYGEFLSRVVVCPSAAMWAGMLGTFCTNVVAFCLNTAAGEVGTGKC